MMPQCYWCGARYEYPWAHMTAQELLDAHVQCCPQNPQRVVYPARRHCEACTTMIYANDWLTVGVLLGYHREYTCAWPDTVDPDVPGWQQGASPPGVPLPGPAPLAVDGDAGAGAAQTLPHAVPQAVATCPVCAWRRPCASLDEAIERRAEHKLCCPVLQAHRLADASWGASEYADSAVVAALERRFLHCAQASIAAAARGASWTDRSEARASALAAWHSLNWLSPLCAARWRATVQALARPTSAATATRGVRGA